MHTDDIATPFNLLVEFTTLFAIKQACFKIPATVIEQTQSQRGQ